MRVLAIDPGNQQSAWVLYDTDERKVIARNIDTNDDMLAILRNPVRCCGAEFSSVNQLAIEMVESFGMAVGKEVFETVYWIGRFCQAWPGEFARVYRKEVKMHLCRSLRAKDPNIRQALIDKLGPVGTKANPGPCFGVRADIWSALAVAVTWCETANMVVA